MVGNTNAHEVGPDGADDGSNEEGEEDVLLLGLAPVSGFWGSISNFVSLEESKEVPGVPSGHEHNSDDGKDDGGVESSSGVNGIIGEENNPERAGNDDWCAQDNGNKDVPPVDVVHEEQVEDLNEKDQGKYQSQGSDDHNTALDWETTTA